MIQASCDARLVGLGAALVLGVLPSTAAMALRLVSASRSISALTCSARLSTAGSDFDFSTQCSKAIRVSSVTLRSFS